VYHIIVLVFWGYLERERKNPSLIPGGGPRVRRKLFIYVKFSLLITIVGRVSYPEPSRAVPKAAMGERGFGRGRFWFRSGI
jgi:hypothetical protein